MTLSRWKRIVPADSYGTAEIRSMSPSKSGAVRDPQCRVSTAARTCGRYRAQSRHEQRARAVRAHVRRHMLTEESKQSLEPGEERRVVQGPLGRVLVVPADADRRGHGRITPRTAQEYPRGPGRLACARATPLASLVGYRPHQRESGSDAVMANQLRCTSKSVDRYAATMHALSALAPTHVRPAAFHETCMAPPAPGCPALGAASRDDSLWEFLVNRVFPIYRVHMVLRSKCRSNSPRHRPAGTKAEASG